MSLCGSPFNLAAAAPTALTHALLYRMPHLATMVKIVSPLSQKEVEGTLVDFEGVAEPWASYKLKDGTSLKVRTIVTAVIRLGGEYDAGGNPVYTVSSVTAVQVSAPKNLRGTPTVPQEVR